MIEAFKCSLASLYSEIPLDEPPSEPKIFQEKEVSNKRLFVSNDLSAIDDPNNSGFAELGEVLHEQFQKIDHENDELAFGVWEIEVDCSLGKVQLHCFEGQTQVFRIVSGLESLSREGEWVSYSLPDDLNDEDRPIWITIDTSVEEPIRHAFTMKTA